MSQGFKRGSNYDIIVLQEIDVKDKLEIFKNWKRKFHSTFAEKKLGFGVAALIKNDIKVSLSVIYSLTLKPSGI